MFIHHNYGVPQTFSSVVYDLVIDCISSRVAEKDNIQLRHL